MYNICKLIMKSMKNWIGIILIFSLLSCGDNPPNKVPSKTAHFYFDNYRSRNFDLFNEIFSVDLPDCFDKDLYGNYSVNNKNNFECYENYTYFTLDAFTRNDIEDLHHYYSSSELNSNYSKFLINHVVKKRAANIRNSIISELTIDSLKTDHSKIYIQSVTSNKNDEYSEDLFYMYGAIEMDNHFYLIQLIDNKENVKFHLNDFKKIMLSFRKTR